MATAEVSRRLVMAETSRGRHSRDTERSRICPTPNTDRTSCSPRSAGVAQGGAFSLLLIVAAIGVVGVPDAAVPGFGSIG